jgi:hypothetical protein
MFLSPFIGFDEASSLVLLPATGLQSLNHSFDAIYISGWIDWGDFEVLATEAFDECLDVACLPLFRTCKLDTPQAVWRGNYYFLPYPIIIMLSMIFDARTGTTDVEAIEAIKVINDIEVWDNCWTGFWLAMLRVQHMLFRQLQ